MSKTFKILVMTVLLTGFAGVTFADRGTGKRSKLKTLLNINTNYSLKNSLRTNLNSGLTYKGSLINVTQQTIGNSVIGSSLMTFQKGNTTYIIPYKQKIMVPDMGPGYTGVKLILRAKN